MAGRKYLLILVIALVCSKARAQQISFQEADSTSNALYLTSNWQQLIDFGQKAIAAGNDFPLLRLRMGYAYFAKGDYSGSIRQYQQVLQNDSHNQVAHEFMYWCNRYLNQDEVASYHASYLDTSVTQATHLSPYGLVEGAVETGIKLNNNHYRGTASYNRIGLSNRLGWHLQLDQSVVYFDHSIKYRRFDMPDRPEVNNSVNQFEYYGKLNYTFAGSWVLFSGYHYLNTSYVQQKYHNHIALLGFKYTGGYIGLQADADMGDINNRKVQQYNTQFTVLPNGNLNLYFISHGALLHQNNSSRFIFSQTVGTKVVEKFWIDADVTFGRLNNYLEADALYVYNALDITKFKVGGTGYYQLNNHALLYVNYTFEPKNDFYQHNHYNQYSITGGLKWKF